MDGPRVGRLPIVSVVMPVRNGQRWIGKSLQSLARQTLQDFEVVIVNDGSTDDTLERIETWRGSLPIRVLDGPGRGSSAARALGVRASRGKFVATHDVDDLSMPSRLADQVAYMTANPECVVVGSWARVIDERGEAIGLIKVPRTHPQICFRMNFNSPFVHSSTVIRRDALLKAGNYSESRNPILADDYDLWIRMLDSGQFHNLPTPLVCYRKTLNGVTSTNPMLIQAQGASLALRQTQSTLGYELDASTREIFAMFFRRDRRIKPGEAFRLYGLFSTLMKRSRWKGVIGGISIHDLVAPLAWVVLAPKVPESRRAP